MRLLLGFILFVNFQSGHSYLMEPDFKEHHENLVTINHFSLEQAAKSLPELEKHYAINYDVSEISNTSTFKDYLEYYRELKRLNSKFSPPLKMKTSVSTIVIRKRLPILSILDIRMKKIEKLLLTFNKMAKDSITQHIKTETI